MKIVEPEPVHGDKGGRVSAVGVGDLECLVGRGKGGMGGRVCGGWCVLSLVSEIECCDHGFATTPAFFHH